MFLLTGLCVPSLNAKALLELGCPAGREEKQYALTYRQTYNLPTKYKTGKPQKQWVAMGRI